MVETKEKKIIKASTPFIRQTARKVRRTANLIRGLSAGEASQSLKFLSYAASGPLKKLVDSAIANASNNFSVEEAKDLKISQLLVDEGPTFKRWRAVSRGRAHSIMKRTSQIKIVLSDMSAEEYADYVWETSARNKKNRGKNKELAQAKKDAKKAKKETAKAAKPKADKKETAKKAAAKKPAAKKAEPKADKKPVAKKPTTKNVQPKAKTTKKKGEGK